MGGATGPVEKLTALVAIVIRSPCSAPSSGQRQLWGLYGMTVEVTASRRSATSLVNGPTTVRWRRWQHRAQVAFCRPAALA